MKALLAGVLLALAMPAQAQLWVLAHQEWVGSYWMCTYQAGHYQMTLASQSMCQRLIDQ